MLKLVVCVGNPGAEYAGNRHNASWQFADFIASPLQLTFVQKSQFRGELAEYGKIFFLKPQTFMNLSGGSAITVMKFYKIVSSEVIVVHDELELPFGTIGLKFGGGLGGHNGLRSMEKNCGTRDFFRLRLGIGRPKHPDVAGYVLSDFSRQENDELPHIFCAAQDMLQEIFSIASNVESDANQEAAKPLLAKYSKKAVALS